MDVYAKTRQLFIYMEFYILHGIKLIKFMGKGDKKTRRGKINMGTYGVRRPKKKTKIQVAPKKSTKKKTKA